MPMRYSTRMPLSLILNVAFVALRRNWLRSALTILGMMVGVTAVITIVALGAGARETVEEQVMSAGTNMITVSAGNWTSGGVRMGMGSSSRLTREDAEALRRVPGVAHVSPGVRARAQMIVAGENWATSVEGTGAELPLIRDWPVALGAFFGPRDVAEAKKVCVLGTIVRDMLFGAGTNPVGQSVRINAQVFTIAGVLSAKGQSSSGRDRDDIVFVPYTTAQKKLLGITHLNTILVSSAPDEVSVVAERIRASIRTRHEIRPGATDDFRVRTLDEIVAVRTRTMKTLHTFLLGVAAVSLLVGGVGVMNIMLVSVTERTREIGLRVALGARSRDVRRQFLAEAVFLSIAGGLAGVAGGYLTAEGLTEWFDWPAIVPGIAVVVSFAFVVAIGIFFGWYPAQKAAAIDPIDALRFE
jgi:putative ABC transport system permease protein